MLRASRLIGGFKHDVQEYVRNGARLQASQLTVATIARLIVLAEADAAFTRGLGMSVVLLGHLRPPAVCAHS